MAPQELDDRANQRLAGRVLRVVPALAWMALIYALSDRPGLRISEDPGVDEPLRSLAHVLVYAVLAVLLLVALGGPADGGRGRRGAWLAFLLAVAWGALDEVHQAFVPDRSAGLGDWALDAVGAALGLVAFLWARAVLRARRRGDRPSGSP